MIDIQNLLHLPACIEKSLNLLLHYLDLKIQGQYCYQEKSIEELIYKEVESLSNGIQIEGIKLPDKTSIIEDIYANLKILDYEQVKLKCSQLLSIIQPFDINKFYKLVIEYQESSVCIGGQDIILLLGREGSGKSTVMHFLAGSHMRKTTIDGLEHIEPTEIKDPVLKKITTSAHIRSGTHYFQAVPLNSNSVGHLCSDTIICCDTPALGDISGRDVDLASIIGMIQAIKKSKSVRPVILISAKSIGDRAELLKELFDSVLKIIPNVTDHIDGFSYLFTKCSQSEASQLIFMLKSLQNNSLLFDKSNHEYKNFVASILEAAEDNESLCLNPIVDEPKQLLKRIIKKNPIRHPGEVFQFTVEDSYLSCITTQVRYIELAIECAIKSNNYLLLEYKISQLKNLHEILNVNMTEHTYKHAIDTTYSYLENYYNKLIDILECYMNNQNKANEADVIRLQELLKCCASLENTIKKFGNCRYDHNFIKIDSYLDKMMKNWLNFSDIIEGKVLQKLNKLKYLASVSNVFVSTYGKKCDEVEPYLKNLFTEIKLIYQSNEHCNSANCLTLILSLYKQFYDNIDQAFFNDSYNCLIKELIAYLESQIKSIEIFLSNFEYSHDETAVYSKFIESIFSARQVYHFVPAINDFLNHAIQSLQKKLDELFLRLYKDIEQTLKFKNENDFNYLFSLINDFLLVNDMFSISNVGSTLEIKLKSLFKHYIEELIYNSQELIRNLCHREKATYIELTRIFIYLAKLKALSKFIPENLISAKVNELSSKVYLYVDSLRKKCIFYDFKLDQYESITSYQEIIYELKDLEILEIFPFIKEIREEVTISFQKQLSKKISHINKVFKLDKSYLSELEYIKHKYERLIQLYEKNAKEQSSKYIIDQGYESESILLTLIEQKEAKIKALKSNNNQNAAYKKNKNTYEQFKELLKRFYHIICQIILFIFLFLVHFPYKLMKNYRYELDETNKKLTVEISSDNPSQVQIYENELLKHRAILDKSKEIYEAKKALIKDAVLHLLCQYNIETLSNLDAKIDTHRALLLRISKKLSSNAAIDFFSVDYLAKIYKFLEVCRQTKLSLPELDDVYVNLHSCLSNYIVYLKNKIVNFFNNLPAFEYSETYIHVSYINLSIKEINKLYQSSDHLIIKILEFVLFSYRESLEIAVVKLSDQLYHYYATNALDLLFRKINTVKLLVNLDNAFRELYSLYYQKSYESIREVYQIVILSIKYKDYITVFNNLENLNNIVKSGHYFAKNILNECKKYLTNSLLKILADLSNRMIFIDRNVLKIELREIVKEIDHLQYIKVKFHNYIDTTLLTITHIEETINKYTNIIQRFLTSILDLTELSIESHDFYVAEENIKYLNQVKYPLRFLISQEKNEKISLLANKLKLQFSAILDKYLSLDISEYQIYPPKIILKQFKKLQFSDNPAYYKALIILKKTISDRFDSELNKAVRVGNATDNNPHLKKCKSALITLPKLMRKMASVKIENCIYRIIDSQNLVCPKDNTSLSYTLQ